jgi:hypothetical protein
MPRFWSRVVISTVPGLASCISGSLQLGSTPYVCANALLAAACSLAGSGRHRACGGRGLSAAAARYQRGRGRGDARPLRYRTQLVLTPSFTQRCPRAQTTDDTPAEAALQQYEPAGTQVCEPTPPHSLRHFLAQAARHVAALHRRLACSARARQRGATGVVGAAHGPETSARVARAPAADRARSACRAGRTAGASPASRTGGTRHPGRAGCHPGCRRCPGRSAGCWRRTGGRGHPGRPACRSGCRCCPGKSAGCGRRTGGRFHPGRLRCPVSLMVVVVGATCTRPIRFRPRVPGFPRQVR